MELQSRLAELQTLGLGVASITYDPPAAIKTFADERNIQFPLLSDETHEIVERYGILNRQFAPGHNNYGIPHPGTFVLNREGRVVARYFEEEFQYRNTAASLALKLGQPVSGMTSPVRRTTPHLEVAAFLTDASVAPGHRFSVVLDVTPASGVRVVAAGEHAFRAVALSLEPRERLRVYGLTPPAGSARAAAPDGTPLPAYAGPFRLVQDVAVVVNAGTRQLAQKPGATVTLNVILEYQACTDTGCAPPQQVPLSWSLALAPLG